MRRVSCRHALAVLCLLAPLANAQSGPGIPPIVYPSNQLFTFISRIGSGNHGHSMMFDGYLAVFYDTSGSGVDFYDISNPYRPVQVQSIRSGMDLSEPHTYARTTAYGGQHVLLLRGPGGLGGTGFAIWDWTDIFNPKRLTAYNLPNVPGGYASGTFWLAAQVPYVYCPVGSLGLMVVDVSDPANPVTVKQLPRSQTGGFNAVVAFAVGNMLVLTNSDSGTGFARFDISDPVDPKLVYSTTNTLIPYGAQVNGNHLLVPAVSGAAASSGGNNGQFRVYGFGEQSFPIVGDLPLPSRGGSVVIQDGFAHIAASLLYLKVDMSGPSYTVVGSVGSHNSGGDEDWVTPLGNLVALSDDQGFGTGLIPHQSLPDSTGPAVTMVVPADGATNQALTSRVGITMSDMIELTSVDTASFTVRPFGGQPLAGSYTCQFGILNFAPAQPLQPNTTYEVEVSAGGMRDWAGNAVSKRFVSRFSTGPKVNAITVVAQPAAAVQRGQTATFDVASTVGSGPFEYSWDFGDGSPPTPFSPGTSASHTYAEAGHYAVLVRATNGSISATDGLVQTVHYPRTAVQPTHSSTILLDESRSRVWCVNADNDTVTAIDTASLQKVREVYVGPKPRTLALAPDGSLWVVCQGNDTVRVLDGGTGSLLATIALPRGSAPYGIAMSPDGSAAWVTLTARGELARLDPAARKLVGAREVGPSPRGIAVAGDSERVFVSRFISSARTAGDDPPYGEVYQVSAARFQPVRTLRLAMDPGPDTEASGRGLPNYLTSLTVSPDGRRLWVPSKKDNIQRGLFRDGNPLTFESTVRTIASQVDLATSREDLAARIDFNDRDSATAIVLSPLADYAFVALQGSNAIAVRDAYRGDLVAGVDGTGLAPQGLALSSDGGRLYVHNFMSRTVSVFDTAGVTSSTDFAMPTLAIVSTVANEKLASDVLRGKQIFYNAADPRMNEDGYISCASCHLEGDSDGETWDFTDRGEGLRNTISMIGHGGTAQGHVHWSGNFDEIQDFENDIRLAFGGDGFLTDDEFSLTKNPLGRKKAGLSPELDALAAYVSSLDHVGRSPHRNPDGSLTAAGVRGKALFQSLQCAQCHSGAGFTDSPSGVRHNVGTIKDSSGRRLGKPLLGIDTPTLRGLWATAPYFHDGSAANLGEVLRTGIGANRHGGTGKLTPQQRRDLMAYLLQIDDLEPAPN